MPTNIREWWFCKKQSLVAQFICNHKMWWNTEDRERWENLI